MSSKKIDRRVKGFLLPLLAASAILPSIDAYSTGALSRRKPSRNRDSGGRMSRKGKIKAKVRARRARDSKRRK